jgi:hypothetical protein
MDDSQPLYDEFGNYIGPALDDDEDEEEEQQQRGRPERSPSPTPMDGAPPVCCSDVEASSGFVFLVVLFCCRFLYAWECLPCYDLFVSANALYVVSSACFSPQPPEVQNPQRAVILHEDKKYFPDASEVYPEAEVIFPPLFRSVLLRCLFVLR